ncbi:putative PEP-binding protein [Algirhabdus cladophorae]|uniref:putative PEP-binding protein n=1 Tax=Algirhabdus cladophorae TaxID=3377108 RepID=UPI003B848DD8
MQKHSDFKDFTLITPTAAMSADTYGGRAKCLQRLIRLEMPVPTTIALSFACVKGIAAGQMPETSVLLSPFGQSPLLSVRPSSQDKDWGGPSAILNIGMNDARHVELINRLGDPLADRLYQRFIRSYAIHVARLDPDDFELPETPNRDTIKAALDAFDSEAGTPFPQNPQVQLAEVLRSMARAWEGTTARLLRQAKGAPADAGLGLVIQSMALGLGKAESGSGVIQFVDEITGEPLVKGRYLPQSQGRDALQADMPSMYLTKDSRGASLEEKLPNVFGDLLRHGAQGRQFLREEMQMEFCIQDGELLILDSVRLPRSSQAAVRIAVALADDGVIAQPEAVLRVEPRALNELLHRQVASTATRDPIARGIPASPGAACGKLVFSGTDAQAHAAQEEACILVRPETTPEDIRGMHAAQAVVTERGGMTSHAAVIGRGLGLPCIVGVSNWTLDVGAKTITTADGRVFSEGDLVTVDGTKGEVLAGQVPMREAALDNTFQTLLGWADQFRDIGVRANADTPADAVTARNFAAEGIGLCRTEHMFFEADRMSVMREMIFADSPEDRKASLDRLLPMQRADFLQLFDIMQGLPVCIRLFDPPLHEFLPSSREGMRELAEALDLALSDVTRRVEAVSEFNPMLGMRGVRLGLTIPEIYDVQSRAIFEATIAAARKGMVIVPEIMIPLVSAKREVEIVKKRIEAVAAAVRTETGADFDFKLGVMVETPRAALRAGDIAQHATFLSFGTNDLTQMTYGLSRDDAGRFMSSYVQQGVYPEDPFHTLDKDGVGELLQIGAERGRAARADVTLSICGEHGGTEDSIQFCRAAGFDYVSCSPFRVPVARLAAAQLALRDSLKDRKT